MHPQLLNDRGSKRPFDVSFRHVCANGHTMGNKAWPNSLENQIVTKLNTLSHQLVAALFQKSLPAKLAHRPAGRTLVNSHSTKDSAQVTAPGAIISMIAAVSSRPNKQNRSARSPMPLPIALARHPSCEPVHVRCVPIRRTPSATARPGNEIEGGQTGYCTGHSGPLSGSRRGSSRCLPPGLAWWSSPSLKTASTSCIPEPITEIGVLAAAAVLFGSRSLEFQQLLQFEA
jgi:hypothetical protein